MDQIRRWHNYPNADTLRRDVINRITVLANHCIKSHGAFRMVLAGGSTPKDIYLGLCDIETDWSGWHIFFGDERCLPEGDPQRNDTMARDTWLNQVSIPTKQIHMISAELGSEVGACAYHDVLVNIGVFDLVLLGLGEDGHTASLFPEHVMVGDSSLSVVAVHNAPKPPPERISLSANRLSQAAHVWFLVVGEGKRRAVEAWCHGNNIPALSICPESGVDIYTDLDVDRL